MKPKEKIEQALLQYEFVIKMLTYIESGKLDKKEFDIDTTIIHAKSYNRFPDNTFNTYDDLKLAAENNFSLMLGALTITIESCLAENGIPNNSQDTTPRGQLRQLIYMIRCAYAHDIMEPKWVIKDRYVKKLTCTAGPYTKEVELDELNGTHFNIEQVGGHGFYFELIKEIRNWL